MAFLTGYCFQDMITFALNVIREKGMNSLKNNKLIYLSEKTPSLYNPYVALLLIKNEQNKWNKQLEAFDSPCLFQAPSVIYIDNPPSIVMLLPFIKAASSHAANKIVWAISELFASRFIGCLAKYISSIACGSSALSIFA